MIREPSCGRAEDAPIARRGDRGLDGGKALTFGNGEGMSFNLSFTDSGGGPQALRGELQAMVGEMHGPQLRFDGPGLLRDLSSTWSALAFEHDGLPDLEPVGHSIGGLELRRVGNNAFPSWAAGRALLGPLPLETTLDILERVGNAVAFRLAKCDEARSEWLSRLPRTDAELRSLDSSQIGRDQERIDRLGIPAPRALNDLIFAGDLRMAARAAGNSVPDSALAAGLAEIRDVGTRSSEAIDRLASDFLASDVTLTGRPHEAGQSVAAWTRRHLGLPDDACIDVETLLHELGVEIRDRRLGSKVVEAFAAWGDYGPVVVVNLDGLFSGTPGGRRITLAHELCHLIVDRLGVLPVAEVAGAVVRTPKPIEARANAFAAELLLPRHVACQVLRRCVDVDTAVRQLTSRFQVSVSVALNQLRNHPDNAAGPTEGQRRRILELLSPRTKVTRKVA